MCGRSRLCNRAARIFGALSLVAALSPRLPIEPSKPLKLTGINKVTEALEPEVFSRPGCYCLLIAFARRRALRIGKLGEDEFPPGTYVYTGSAMGGLEHRLRRHLARRKKLRWHIDYLLSAPQARIKEILVYSPAPGQECRRNQVVARLPGAQMILRRFGASDCSTRCATHLYFFPRNQAATRIAAALRRHCSTYLVIDKPPAGAKQRIRRSAVTP